MKRNVWLAALLALVLILAACGRREAPVETETPTPAETESVETETSIPAETETDFAALYQAKLQEICDYIALGNAAEEIPEGLTGVRETMIFDEPAAVRGMIGYAITDLSGDGVPELIVATMPVEDAEETRCNILALYTVQNGAVKLVNEGWARNCWYLLQDGTLYNSGSNGAAYAVDGIYRLAADGSALECVDYYFTYEKTEGDYDDIGVYHNTTGVYDKTQSELLDMTTEELWDMNAQWLAQVQNPNLTALSQVQ